MEERESGRAGVGARSEQIGATDARQRGSGLVEFALLAPLLVTLLLGILELGRILDAWLIVTNAAREGARIGAQGATATDIRNRTYSYLVSGVGSRTDVGLPAQSEIAVANPGGLPGGAVSVRVPLRVQIYTPLVQGFLPSNPVPLWGSATMRLQ